MKYRRYSPFLPKKWKSLSECGADTSLDKTEKCRSACWRGELLEFALI